jgi:hypothetical protein
MSALSDDYTKKFSSEKKALFNKRFRDDYDPNMSERSNIIRILEEMRELKLADGGRIGLKEGLGSFTTNDPTEAFKEIISRIIDKNIKGTTLPISDNISLNLGPKMDEVELGGILKVLGGELSFGGGLKGDDKGVGFSFKKEFNKGGRVAYQDGTPERKDYETPVTDAIKSVNEKTQDLIMKGKEGFEKFTGVDQIKSNYPGSYASPIGQPSDFRHQAASNLVAEALGKGAYTDPILGPISYLSGGIGSFGLGTVKEIGDLVAGLLDKNTTAKDAFSQAYEDTKSNFKGAFAPVGTTSEDLYAELMKDYDPRGLRMIDPFKDDQMAQIFQQRKKALEDARKKQKDKIITPIKKPTKTVTGTTKQGTGGGGGDGTFGVGSDGQKSFDSGQGFGINATTGGPVSNKTGKGRKDYSLGGLARMLGE